jgi:hypothetical protein
MRQITPGEIGITEETVFRIRVEGGSQLILMLPKARASEIIKWATEEGIAPERLLSQIIARGLSNPRNPANVMGAIATQGHCGQAQVAGRLFPIQQRKRRQTI